MTEQLKCDRCHTTVEPVLQDISMQGDNMLNVKLSGGYSQFIDNEIDYAPEPYTDLQLCHKCGHEFMTGFMGVPAEKYSYWHPADGSDYCKGWHI